MTCRECEDMGVVELPEFGPCPECQPREAAFWGAECPFCDLPPEQVVHVQFGEPGVALPYSAERACSEWHLAQSMAAKMDAAQNVLDQGLTRKLNEQRSAELMRDPRGHPLIKPRPPRAGDPW